MKLCNTGGNVWEPPQLSHEVPDRVKLQCVVPEWVKVINIVGKSHQHSGPCLSVYVTNYSETLYKVFVYPMYI